MRLLAIRLQNLNSLSGGIQEVRFDTPPLSQAGVFLITGPTGAGKSTLLDAVTLALYGRAARYGNDKADEMLSRHTAECLAEVDFESQGRQLRATWRLRRARGKVDGKLQPVERRLSDVATGEILAEKSGEMDRLIESMTGLDAQRFLRSVLLAQGQFAAFLKAKPNERADLLEKITGTEIYSDLSVLAFDTYKAKDDAAIRLRERLGALTVISDEDRAELTKQLSEAKESGLRLHQENQTSAKRLNDLRQLQQQQRDLTSVEADLAKLSAAIQTITRQQAEAAEAVTKTHGEAAQAKQSRAAREPVWEQAAKLTAQSEQFEKLLVESRAIYQTQARDQKAALSRRDAADASLKTHDVATQALDAWLKKHAHDGGLEDVITKQRENVRVWRSAFQTLDQGRRVHTEAQALSKKQAESQASAAKLEQDLKTTRESLSALSAESERVTKTWDQQRQVVDLAQQVAGFEDHRHELKSGAPCPLCGAVEHPFASADVNFTSQLQAAKRLLIELNQHREKLTREATATEQTVTRTEERLRGEKEKLAEIGVQLSKIVVPDLGALETVEARAREAVDSRLRAVPSPDDAERELMAMDKRARAFAAKQTEANEQRAQRQKIEADLQLATQDVEAKTKRLDELEAEGVKLKAQADELKQTLTILLGDRTLQQDRDWHEQLLAKAEKAQRQAESQANTLLTKLAAARATRDQQEARRIELDTKLAGAEIVSTAALADAEQETAKLAEQLAAIQKSAGAFEERLRSDDEARKRREEGGVELRAAETEAIRWGRLKELIGSADGSRFARFAQSLTLRQLIGLANLHLEVLSPRYRLMAAEGDELDLRIVDLYQAGVDRPMESLSGGESFLASLALALGLSELASRHHPIDSLFIDEGFGTLDSETLEIALSALENLRSQGKTIGLISHVDLLKERIATQVRINRAAGGTSVIQVV